MSATPYLLVSGLMSVMHMVLGLHYLTRQPLTPVVALSMQSSLLTGSAATEPA